MNPDDWIDLPSWLSTPANAVLDDLHGAAPVPGLVLRAKELDDSSEQNRSTPISRRSDPACPARSAPATCAAATRTAAAPTPTATNATAPTTTGPARSPARPPASYSAPNRLSATAPGWPTTSAYTTSCATSKPSRSEPPSRPRGGGRNDDREVRNESSKRHV